MTNLYHDLGGHSIDAETRTIKFERDPAQEYQQQELARTISYVHCWFTGDSANEAMWQEYGDDCGGVCIESSSHSLLRSVSQPANVAQMTCGEITYSDGSQPIATAIGYTPFFHKHERYANEREIRLVAELAYDPDTLQFDNTSERLAIPVDLPKLIHRVVLGRGGDRDTEIEITGLVAEFTGNTQIVRQTQQGS